ncbi:MAG: glutamate synthase [Oscillospiraceae bacterium]|nr:glutamate synthase [Oscillospiraceae bacterium]MBR3418763.1 glutamate synthase [Oscillospiraceae bacterium]
MELNVSEMGFSEVNEQMRQTADSEITLTGCIGQRFLAAGTNGKYVRIRGIAGNALGAYLNGSVIETFGNAQDAVGDTMNEGKIIVHGNIGDAAGYAMRGGRIFVQGNAGYRAGIHMKAYQDKVPVMVIGGRTGSFLGEYQAGGIIIVLGLSGGERPIVSNFPCTGMHGGKLFLRSDCAGIHFPHQVHHRAASAEELAEIRQYVEEYCEHFGGDSDEILNAVFTLVTPDSGNPYKQMYVAN